MDIDPEARPPKLMSSSSDSSKETSALVAHQYFLFETDTISDEEIVKCYGRLRSSEEIRKRK